MKDFEIRYILHNDVLCHYWEDGESKVVDELIICNGESIADLAVINGSITGFEIKSEHDNLGRLPQQITYYNKVFDYISVVTSIKHLAKINALIPNWWGILLVQTIDEKSLVTEIRKSEKNEHIDPFSLAQFLWKEELLDLIDRFNLDSSIKKKRRWLIWEHISQNITLTELKEEVNYYLKSRINWKISDFYVTKETILER